MTERGASLSRSEKATVKRGISLSSAILCRVVAWLEKKGSAVDLTYAEPVPWAIQFGT